MTIELLRGQRRDEYVNGAIHVSLCWMARQAKHSDASIFSGWKDERVGEVEIKGNEGSALTMAMKDEVAIHGPGKTLFKDGRYIVAGFADDTGRSVAEILVKLDLQRDFSTGSSTYRSRDISAP